MIAIQPQYITDHRGNKISAVLSTEEFRALLEGLEELEDIKLYDESKREQKRQGACRY